MNKIKKSILFYELGEETIKKMMERITDARNGLGLSNYAVSKATGISIPTLERSESGNNTPTLETLVPLIFFYGFTLAEFFDFDKPLPDAKKLKRKMMAFHRKTGSDAYEKVFSQPKLNDLIPEELIPNSYFDDYRTVAEVVSYCKEEFGYTYENATNTLNIAVKKGWLVADEKSKPKRYKRKG